MLDDCYRLFLNELDFIKDSSYFVSQSIENQDDCGGLVEIAIRKFLREVVGERFKITHGYIYSSLNRTVSPQIDVMITDKLVPHCLKKFDYLDNLEIVPSEAVVGVFEVKRTLNTAIMKRASKQLIDIFNAVPLLKDHPKKYLPGGIELVGKNGISIDGGKYSNPIIGIIGLLHKNSKELDNIQWPIDVLFSFQGLLKAPKDGVNNSLKPFTFRKSSDTTNYLTVSDPKKREIALKGFVAYLLQYLNEVSGRIFDMNAYLS